MVLVLPGGFLAWVAASCAPPEEQSYEEDGGQCASHDFQNLQPCRCIAVNLCAITKRRWFGLFYDRSWCFCQCFNGLFRGNFGQCFRCGVGSVNNAWALGFIAICRWHRVQGEGGPGFLGAEHVSASVGDNP